VFRLWLRFRWFCCTGSLVASRELDVQIRQMVHAESWLWPSARETKSDPAALIAQLSNASGVAILRFVSPGKYRVAANHGFPLLPSVLKSHGLSIEWPQSPGPLKNENAFSGKVDPEMVFLFHERQDIQAQELAALKCALGDGNPPAGFLILLHQKDERMPLELLRISAGNLPPVSSWGSELGRQRMAKQWKPRAGHLGVCCLVESRGRRAHWVR